MPVPAPTAAADPVWVGRSAATQWVKTLLREIGSTDLPVLIQGEPGTGKRLAARMLHVLGARRSQPFVTVRCSALHPPDVGTYVFGTEWPGARSPGRPRDGALAGAAGGTLFLDDVDALPLAPQEALLDLLRRQRDADLAGAQAAPPDVRFVAATQTDLESLVRAGTFSGELYYRLNVAAVRLPPLRSRRQDIPWLALYFARQCAARMGRASPEVAQEAIAVLLRQEWPGNVWQLKRLLEQATVLAGEGSITAPQLERLLLNS